MAFIVVLLLSDWKTRASAQAMHSVGAEAAKTSFPSERAVCNDEALQVVLAADAEVALHDFQRCLGHRRHCFSGPSLVACRSRSA